MENGRGDQNRAPEDHPPYIRRGFLHKLERMKICRSGSTQPKDKTENPRSRSDDVPRVPNRPACPASCFHVQTLLS